MANQDAFTIYNASAGSGKTFTLVKTYLSLALGAKNPLLFRTLLALTFTNKAVNEMKSRIIDALKLFAKPDILHANNTMFNALVLDLKTTPNTLHETSKLLLQIIVHNYASFDISTIDKFNHRLVRTFAHDLKLPVNFEVELDTSYLLAKAVDRLIDQAGNDKKLTQVLIDFAIEKADDDRSWNIERDLNEIAKLLVNESHITYLDEIKTQSLNDFLDLKNTLANKKHKNENTITKIAKEALLVIDANDLEFSDFSSGWLPKYFNKLSHGNFNVGFTAGWQKDLIEGNTLYPKRVTEHVAETINNIQPQLAIFFEKTKTALSKNSFLKNCLKNITPFSVLNAISKTLDDIKTEDNLLLISEFNTIIHNEISKQPAPFIYERLGEKYKHYFIDEFQDTSIMQWHNLIPLVENAVSGETLKGERGSVMLVGDAKQAIYRWRGGYAEQFIDLYKKKTTPFPHTKTTLKELNFNYRSAQTIVDFNNAFFQHISELMFLNNAYKDLYKASKQQAALSHSGYIELDFLNIENGDKDTLHCEKTHACINKALSQEFLLSDICIIVRKNKEGVALAEFLSNQGVPVVSSESLLLKNAPEVNFIINVLRLSIQPQNNEITFNILLFLNQHIKNIDNTHAFLFEGLQKNTFRLFQDLSCYGFHFNFNTFTCLPIYEAVEHIIRSFNLCPSSNAYVQFFLDEVLNFSKKHEVSISSFLAFWDQKKDSLSIVSPQETNAVQIMTIHKAKGLEFPVVIFPFANQDIYFNVKPKVWFPINPKEYHGFQHIYINMNKDVETYGHIGEQLFNQHKAQLELDAINLLYVVLTRAVKQLYVISEYEMDKNKLENHKKYSGLFISYLKNNNLWQENKTSYTFGEPEKYLNSREKKHALTLNRFISTSREEQRLKIITNSGYIWNTKQEAAIEKGNLIHDILAKIKTVNDVDVVFKDFIRLGRITLTQQKTLNPLILSIINHNRLKQYYSDLKTFNEKDIITKSGVILRPDKIVVNNKHQAVIIDYKTGYEKEDHYNQMQKYHEAVQDIGLTVLKKILVYINQDIQIKEL